MSLRRRLGQLQLHQLHLLHLHGLLNKAILNMVQKAITILLHLHMLHLLSIHNLLHLHIAISLILHRLRKVMAVIRRNWSGNIQEFLMITLLWSR